MVPTIGNSSSVKPAVHVHSLSTVEGAVPKYSCTWPTKNFVMNLDGSITPALSCGTLFPSEPAIYPPVPGTLPNHPCVPPMATFSFMF